MFFKRFLDLFFSSKVSNLETGTGTHNGLCRSAKSFFKSFLDLFFQKFPTLRPRPPSQRALQRCDSANGILSSLSDWELFFLLKQY